MCGIVGLQSPGLTPFDAADNVAAASRLLTHRGPDDAGLYVDEGIALAVRRLSIIDLEGGHQPLSNEDGQVWIAYNGEVFNAVSLRAELEAAGHRFRTQTDTEVVVHAYEEWGEAAVECLQGMFAFALWDAPRRRLLLTRDRFGIKPLYYADRNGTLAFASEIQPLLAALPELPRRADRTALWRMLELGSIPAPLTAFEGVCKLPAGHSLVVEPGRTRLTPYWRPQFPPAGCHASISLDDAAAEFGARLKATVDAWRMSHVPVGSLLSGGVDSASLAALLTELDGGPIHTFSIGFAAASHDEAQLARDTARWLGSQHHEVVFSAADFDQLPAAICHLEEPRTSATCIPIYLLYQACHEAGFKVIMTGEGADELLGGYPWFDGDRRARPLLRLPVRLRSLLARLPLSASPGARRILRAAPTDPIRRYALWQRVGRPDQLSALLRSTQAPVFAGWQERYAADLHGRHPLDQFLFLESQTRLVDFINLEVDRMSMASSVEARPPFLDHELWEFCAALPPGYKLSQAGGKRLLRRAMRGHLPHKVRQRPKRGLATPHAAWWRSERLPVWAEEALHPSALSDAGDFDPQAVRDLRELHHSGQCDTSQLLMGVLTTQLWHERVLMAG
jgi:asparagine synthase (glutamine-hydrolysing)